MLQEIAQKVRENINNEIIEACESERDSNILSATLAMKELKVSDQDIIKELQKYFDLRLSEAEAYIRRANRKMFTTIK